MLMLWTFNRTSMELKLEIQILNNPRVVTFNRTSMELKLITQLQPQNILVGTFNRTSMELKRVSDRLQSSEERPFNRTSMELKPQLDKSLTYQRILLIEPVWN